MSKVLPVINLTLLREDNRQQALLKDALTGLGMFYVIAHPVEKKCTQKLFDVTQKFFSAPKHEKMKLFAFRDGNLVHDGDVFRPTPSSEFEQNN